MAHRRLPVCRRAACGMLQEGLLRDGVHPQAAFAALLGRRHRTDPRGAGLRLQRRHDAVDGRILRRRPERDHHLEGEPFGADDRSGGRLRPLRIRRGLRLAAAAPLAGDTDGRRRRPREPRLRLYAAEVGAEPAAPLRFGGLPHLEGGQLLQGRQLELLQRILHPARLPRLLHPARGAEHGGRRGGAVPSARSTPTPTTPIRPRGASPRMPTHWPARSPRRAIRRSSARRRPSRPTSSRIRTSTR